MSTSPKKVSWLRGTSTTSRPGRAARTCASSASQPWVARTSSKSASRWRASWRSAKSSWCGRIVVSRTLTCGRATCLTPARAARRARHATVECSSSAARLVVTLCSSRARASSRSGSPDSACVNVGPSAGCVPVATRGTPAAARWATTCGSAAVRSTRRPCTSRSAAIAASVSGLAGGEVADGLGPLLAPAAGVDHHLVDRLEAGVRHDGRGAVDDRVDSHLDGPGRTDHHHVRRHHDLRVTGLRSGGVARRPHVETRGGLATGVRHDDSPVAGVDAGHGLAGELGQHHVGADRLGEAEDREHPAAGLAGHQRGERRPLGARDEDERLGGVGEPERDDAGLADPADRGREPSQRRAVGGHPQDRLPAAADVGGACHRRERGTGRCQVGGGRVVTDDQEGLGGGEAIEGMTGEGHAHRWASCSRPARSREVRSRSEAGRLWVTSGRGC